MHFHPTPSGTYRVDLAVPDVKTFVASEDKSSPLAKCKMVYTLSVVSTVEQCDTVITQMSAERTAMQGRLNTALAELNADANEISEIPSRIAQLDVQIAEKQAAIAASTSPVEQANLGIELNRLETDRLRLVRRQLTFGSIPFVERQFSLGRLEFKIAAYTEFIAAVEARKAEIIAAGNAAA